MACGKEWLDLSISMMAEQAAIAALIASAAAEGPTAGGSTLTLGLSAAGALTAWLKIISALMGLGNCLQQNGKFDEAKKFFDRARALQTEYERIERLMPLH